MDVVVRSEGMRGDKEESLRDSRMRVKDEDRRGWDVRKGQGLRGANCSRATVCARMCRWVALEEISVSVEPVTHNLIVDIQARSVSPAMYWGKSGRRWL